MPALQQDVYVPHDPKTNLHISLKGICGIVFIILALLLTLAIVGQLPALFGTFFGYFAIFSGNFENLQTGVAIGNVIYWKLIWFDNYFMEI